MFIKRGDFYIRKQKNILNTVTSLNLHHILFNKIEADQCSKA